MKKGKKYSVEIIQDNYLLAQAFNLRYKINKQINPAMVAHCTQPFECDVYDKRSIHIGLFLKIKNEKLLVGYSRFVLPAALVKLFKGLINDSHPLYKHADLNVDEERLPFIAKLPFNKFLVANNQCFLLEQHCKIYFEASSLLIDERYRSFSAVKFFISGIYALAQVLNPSFVIISGCGKHERYYSNLGFTPFNYSGLYKTNTGTEKVLEINLSTYREVPTLVRYLKMQYQIEQQMSWEFAA